MEMNENHREVLKALLSVTELPQTVTDIYFTVKKMADRKDVFINHQVLLFIATMAVKEGTVAAKPDTPEPVLLGRPCTVFWNGKTEDAFLLEDQKATEQGMCVVALAGQKNTSIEIAEHNVKMKE